MKNLVAASPSSQVKQPREVKWNKPEENEIKVNVDGSCFGKPPRAGFGGVLRNANGEWIAAFSGAAGEEGHMRAWHLGYRWVWCETDSEEALRLVTGQVEARYHAFGSVIADVRELLKRDCVARVSHTLREANRCADFVAKLGAAGLASSWVEPSLA